MRSQRTASLLALTALAVPATTHAAPPKRVAMRAATHAIQRQATIDTASFGARAVRVGRCHRLSWRTIECWATFFDVHSDGENWDQAAVRYHARRAGRRIVATTPDYLAAR